ncbi:cytochrome b-c1 complex subunit 8-like [Leptidea sinapis]|uniref:Cytochrome b-c1 complex subunit 8 n=1 Tax=Leptidea sinapis TaxID=189913 RepID=A0A5E4QMU8_9NEOP|nr:cytochrome b-c1 complex subunit 8-like [Leptidea sinapis]VVC98649.1 unnamed protein product [Leptidea sinapis]
MGKHFGELYTIRGIIYYTISPHEQKPFAGCIKGIPNIIFVRTLPRMWTWLPTLITTILVYKGVEAAHKQSKRKNPDDYINEVKPEE